MEPHRMLNAKKCLRHKWNNTHVSDECKVLIAEADKLKRQHEAGSKESRGKTREDYKKIRCPKRVCIR